MADMYFYRDFGYSYVSQTNHQNPKQTDLKLETCFLNTEKINQYLDTEFRFKIGFLTHRNLQTDISKEINKWNALEFDWDFF